MGRISAHVYRRTSASTVRGRHSTDWRRSGLPRRKEAHAVGWRIVRDHAGGASLHLLFHAGLRICRRHHGDHTRADVMVAAGMGGGGAGCGTTSPLQLVVIFVFLRALQVTEHVSVIFICDSLLGAAAFCKHGQRFADRGATVLDDFFLRRAFKDDERDLAVAEEGQLHGFLEQPILALVEGDWVCWGWEGREGVGV